MANVAEKNTINGIDFSNISLDDLTAILNAKKESEKNKQFTAVFAEIDKAGLDKLFNNDFLKTSAVKILKSQYKLYNDTDREGALLDGIKSVINDFPAISLDTEYYIGSGDTKEKYRIEVRKIKDVVRKTPEEKRAELLAALAELDKKTKK